MLNISPQALRRSTRFGWLLVAEVCARVLAPSDVFAQSQPSQPIELTADVSIGRKPISPFIYGLNFAKESFAKEISLPLRRWGGNSTSRYNWQINGMNHGSDWFFHNNSSFNPFTLEAETADDWVLQNQRTGTESLMTVPIMGYVAKDADPSTCGFSVAVYGAQDQSDLDSGFPDCGNGVFGGVNLTGNQPTDTSIATPPNFTTDWINHLHELYLLNHRKSEHTGPARFFELDNEPGLWHQAHRDVHPAPLTYRESFLQGASSALAIKSATSSTLVFGPVQDGWARYWWASYTSGTEAAAEQDRQDHAGIDFISWYLQQMNGYELGSGKRLLDGLDLHFYPQNGVALTTAGSGSMQALRLRSTRALWDPSYVDESWIHDAGPDNGVVRLIPRMHDWVNDNYPGTLLALSEYNWGGLENINGALAQADLLGIFGEQGLDMATLWNNPYPANEQHYDVFETLPGAYAFRMYRNYDGNGGKFGDQSFTASSSARDRLTIFAARHSDTLVVTMVIINKTAGVLTANLNLNISRVPPAALEVYRYSERDLNAIVRETDQRVGVSRVSLSFPANSITLLVTPH